MAAKKKKKNAAPAPAKDAPAMVNIESHLVENRIFKPAKGFAKKARIGSMEEYRSMWKNRIKQPEKFWGNLAKDLDWRKKPKKTLEWKAPFAKWFIGGKLNVSENCLDRHLRGSTKNKAAIIWEGEPGETRTITYSQLHRDVCRFANVLKRNRVRKGDRVLIYMPMIPEAAIAMLACARLGAIHSVIFGGFSSESIKDRAHDSGAICIVTADGGYRRGTIVPLKQTVDAALKAGTTQVTRVLVFRRAHNEINIEEGRDVWWHRELQYVGADCPAAEMDSEDPLFILYTSGSTGKPKGILHTTAGYLLGTYVTTKLVFDLRPGRRLLVHRRRRLDHGPQLPGVRPARERSDLPDVRGRAELAGIGPLLEDHRRARRDDSLHGSDRDSRVHQVGHRMAYQA